MADYAKDVLVDTQWVENHLNDDSIRVVEVDENPALYTEAHIPGAIVFAQGWQRGGDEVDGRGVGDRGAGATGDRPERGSFHAARRIVPGVDRPPPGYTAGSPWVPATNRCNPGWLT